MSYAFYHDAIHTPQWCGEMVTVCTELGTQGGNTSWSRIGGDEIYFCSAGGGGQNNVFNIMNYMHKGSSVCFLRRET